MSIAPLAMEAIRLCVWLALLAAIFVPLERWFAIRRHTGRRGDVALDLVLYFSSALVPALLLAAPLALVSTLSHRILPAGYHEAIGALPFWARLALGFVLGEVGFYWGHRWTHEVPALWRFHAVHHSPVRMDWLVNSRSHPIDMIFVRLCGLAPVHLIGLSGGNAAEGGSIGALVVVTGTIWGFFLHANIRWRFGALEQVVATPAFHHWHHVADGPINRNYAAMLPMLDRLFGTYHLPARQWPTGYGIAAPPPAPAEAVIPPLAPSSPATAADTCR